MANAARRGFECLSMPCVQSATRKQKHENLTAEQLWRRFTVNSVKHARQNPMKKLFIPVLVVFSAMTLLAGCAWQVGGDKKVTTAEPTVGQQLIDLQKAKDAGVIRSEEHTS